jgi:hypothetical protein
LRAEIRLQFGGQTDRMRFVASATAVGNGDVHPEFLGKTNANSSTTLCSTPTLVRVRFMEGLPPTRAADAHDRSIDTVTSFRSIPRSTSTPPPRPTADR